ncbi:unnamed protein product [Ilex paraguariensis]|uniref:Uncharacterized protein n=1 Tax=Ilex paraguariensis TaxID=185542 RepID=A0ABC8R564_9AQUA
MVVEQNRELDRILKVAERSKRMARDVASKVKELHSSLQTNFEACQDSFKEDEDKAYDESFKKFEHDRVDPYVCGVNVPTVSELYSRHAVTIPGGSLAQTDPPTVESPTTDVLVADHSPTDLCAVIFAR